MIFDVNPRPLTHEDVEGTVWERLASLRGESQLHPFSIDGPGQDENPQLYGGEVRRIAYQGQGEVLLYNIDLPVGVTLALSLDGVVKRFSHGNEAGVLRWQHGQSPLRFTNSLQIVITNTTGAGQTYRVHVSGA